MNLGVQGTKHLWKSRNGILTEQPSLLVVNTLLIDNYHANSIRLERISAWAKSLDYSYFESLTLARQSISMASWFTCALVRSLGIKPGIFQ